MPTSQVPTTMLIRVQDLAGSQEIARMLNVSRQRVSQIISKPDFPEPEAVLAMGKVWDAKKVREWAAARGRIVYPLDSDQT